MNEPTVNELIDIAQCMAHELKQAVNDAKDAGCDQPGITSVLNDWEAIYRRTNKYGMNMLIEEGAENSLIAALDNQK